MSLGSPEIALIDTRTVAFKPIDELPVREPSWPIRKNRCKASNRRADSGDCPTQVPLWRACHGLDRNRKELERIKPVVSPSRRAQRVSAKAGAPDKPTKFSRLRSHYASAERPVSENHEG